MSADDERDLSSAFEELTAPPSTANYATRTPGLDIRTTSSRWPQAVATALAVLVAVGGAGTFLALRNARQGGAPSSAIGNPPARSGAAMAYDSTDGYTVMFGGTGASGVALTDTWTWNGSVWTSAAHGPGPLADVRMVDDPVNAGVLLVGMPVQASSGGAVGCAGSGTANPGTVTGTTPVASTAPSPKSKPSVPTGVPGRVGPVRPTGPPLADPVPTGALATAPPVSAPAGFVCPPPVATPAEQTWVFSSGGWRRVQTGSAMPPAGSQLAFDGTTRQVVAVSGGAYSCGPPLESAVKSGASIVCPVMHNSTSSSGPSLAAGGSLAPCSVVLGCMNGGTVSTWTWSGDRWTMSPAYPPVQDGVTLVFNDPATHHATLMTQSGATPYPACQPLESCPAPPSPLVTTWAWTGSTWRQLSQVPNHQQSPVLGAASIAAVDGHIVVLTMSGETWIFAAGQWTQDTSSVVAPPTNRFGAAMAAGPSGSVVLFGGGYVGGLPAASGAALDSDTWTWSDGSWKHVAGREAVSLVGPTCPAQAKGGAIPPCVQVLPAPAPGSSPTGCSPSAGCIQVQTAPATTAPLTPTATP